MNSNDNENIKKQALRVKELIDEGSLNEKDLPLLIREGLDSRVVDYYNKFKSSWLRF